MSWQDELMADMGVEPGTPGYWWSEVSRLVGGWSVRCGPVPTDDEIGIEYGSWTLTRKGAMRWVQRTKRMVEGRGDVDRRLLP